MDRRELLKHGAAAAVVAALPITLLKPSDASTALTPGKPPMESPSTLALRHLIRQQLEPFRLDKRLGTLTPDQWDSLADNHQAYMAAHAAMGCAHGYDNWFRTNEGALKAKYPTKVKRIDDILYYGCYKFQSMASAGIHEAAGKMRLERCGGCTSSLEHGHLVEAQYTLNCENAFNNMELMYEILAISFAIPGPGEVVAIFAILGIITNLMGQYMCGGG